MGNETTTANLERWFYEMEMLKATHKAARQSRANGLNDVANVQEIIMHDYFYDATLKRC